MMKTQKTMVNTVSPQEMEQRLNCFQMAMRDFIVAFDRRCVVESRQQMLAMMQSARAYPITASLKRGGYMEPTQFYNPQSVIGVFKSCAKYLQCRETKIQYTGGGLRVDCADFEVYMGVMPCYTKPRVVMYVSKNH